MTPWRQLERSVQDALQAYQREGKLGCISHSVARQVGGRWVGKAPVDYHATLKGGRALALEVKQTHGKSLPMRDWQPHQQQELERQHALGAMAMLLVDYMPDAKTSGEIETRQTYVLPWTEELQQFVQAPWRESISRAMARAWGLQVAWRWDGSLRRSYPLLLEATAHPVREQAIAEVEQDRLTCTAKPERAYMAPLQMSGPKSKAELLERVQQAIVIGTRNAARRGR